MVLSPKEYLEQNLGKWLLADEEFHGHYEVVSCSATTSDQLDGFMSTIYMCDVVLQRLVDQQECTVKLVTKVMKGSAEFRETSKSFVQCRNEVFIYDKVIPYLKSFIKNRKTTMEPDEWTPKVFHQFYGKIPELSDIDECILAMENVSVSGFRNGPRLELDLNHFQVMLKPIAEYHAVQYAMRILKDPMLDELKSGLTMLPWKDPSGSTDNLFEVLYPVAFDRLFEYLDRRPEELTSERMKEEVKVMREKFGKDPVALLELFREDDPAFSVILHGDYNRNNVLYKYSKDEPDVPVSLRMIDFQEVRYASPAIDLFFFFYMSSTAEFREKHWEEIIELYHSRVWLHLKELLNCDDSDSRLATYSLENFQKHFARFAFYGTMVTIHFLPWMDCSPEELAPLADEFTHNMKSEKCRKLLLSVGGDDSNKKLVAALRHAIESGYLAFIKELP